MNKIIDEIMDTMGQAFDFIHGDQPEVGSVEESRDDTLQKLRKAMADLSGFYDRCVSDSPTESAVSDLAARLTAASAELRGAREEIAAWHECAVYDATMAGPVFSGRWNRSALDRCRKQYIEGDIL